MVRGQDKLNLAFVANLFNNHPALDPPEEEFEIIEETREEKVSEINYNKYLYVNFYADVPQLDELSRCQTSRELYLLRLVRWSRHFPGLSR